MLRLDLFRIISHVSEKVLASTLNYLEGEGLAKRASYDLVPPCVEYSLTPLARNFIRENFYRKVKKIQYFPTLEELQNLCLLKKIIFRVLLLTLPRISQFFIVFC